MEKTSRPVRNRRHSRRAWSPGEIHRPVKRLFTPEIKRMLKDWLVRRRDNPYPSREEKKALAGKSGLTYIQICNWFANWRRKLKNAGDEPQKKTWGHLIKTYNVSASGNVEQFSICSNDSIWEDEEKNPRKFTDIDDNDRMNGYNRNFGDKLSHVDNLGKILKNMPISEEKLHNNQYRYVNGCSLPSEILGDHEYLQKYHTILSQEQCYQVTSTTNNNNSSYTVDENNMDKNTCTIYSNAKYKNHIMEKYLRGLDYTNNSNKNHLELSKWLESTANFTPNKNNYIEWDTARRKSNKLRQASENNHQKDEIEAAEALTCLAGNYRNRMFNHSN